MRNVARTEALKLSEDEIGYIFVGMMFASHSLRVATREITEEYSLGPRGAWITRLISTGDVVFPLDLTKSFRIGRSLITAELNRLIEAGLIVYQKCPQDGRRVELKLTPLGQTVQQRVKDKLASLVTRSLASYGREDALLCARMLHDLVNTVPESLKLK
jgi:DNA-binding MarR family transcriptional regulator